MKLRPAVNNILDAKRTCKPKGNTSSTLFTYGEYKYNYTEIHWNEMCGHRLKADWNRSDRPSVTRNILTEGSCELSDNVISLYYENLLLILTSTYGSHGQLKWRASVAVQHPDEIWKLIPIFFLIFTLVNLNFLIWVLIPSLYGILLYWQGNHSYPGCRTGISAGLVALMKSAMSLIYEIFSSVEFQARLGA
jgi:hypothetical protein